ncbi:hypothetical protein JYU34_019061 [Plutella xylostella]|uniref:Uncharacterized protein n=1 Tax=Plutella xylostella TaxID=51655 RepID=A0ABQ7PZ26_PLUXY|nr:hypothetical protein JYU34_019061 [Plutella xylostella]
MAGAARGSRGARGVLPWLLLISSVSGYVETDEFISDLDKPRTALKTRSENGGAYPMAPI